MGNKFSVPIPGLHPMEKETIRRVQDNFGHDLSQYVVTPEVINLGPSEVEDVEEEEA